MKLKRPFLLWLLVGLFLLAGITALIGVIGAIKSWNWMVIFSSVGGVFYRIFKNAFLFLALLLSAVVLWRRLSWSIIYSIIIVILSAAWFWVDRLVITKNPLPVSQQVFPLTITCIVITCILLLLLILQPGIQIYNKSKKLSIGQSYEWQRK